MEKLLKNLVVLRALRAPHCVINRSSFVFTESTKRRSSMVSLDCGFSANFNSGAAQQQPSNNEPFSKSILRSYGPLKL